MAGELSSGWSYLVNVDQGSILVLHTTKYCSWRFVALLLPTPAIDSPNRSEVSALTESNISGSWQVLKSSQWDTHGQHARPSWSPISNCHPELRACILFSI